MPIKVSWYIPKRVLLAKSTGINTNEDVLAVNQEYLAFLEEAEFPAYLISDETEIVRTDISLSTVRDSFKYLSRFDYVISVGSNLSISTLPPSRLIFSQKR